MNYLVYSFGYLIAPWAFILFVVLLLSVVVDIDYIKALVAIILGYAFTASACAIYYTKVQDRSFDFISKHRPSPRTKI